MCMRCVEPSVLWGEVQSGGQSPLGEWDMCTATPEGYYSRRQWEEDKSSNILWCPEGRSTVPTVSPESPKWAGE